MNIIDLINTPQKDLILSDQQIQQLTLEEVHQRHLMLQEILSGVLDYDIVISDTNVWLELNAVSHSDNRGNTRLMFERQLDFISKMMRHRGGKFIIMGETYEEIDRFAAVQDPVNHKEADFSDNLVYLNAAARLAKRLILSMQRENRLRIEGISSESHHAAFADPAIVRRVVELFTEGKKVLLLTNDASVAIRSIALCDDLQRINAIGDDEWNATYTQLRPMAFTFDDLRLLDNYTRQYHYIQMADGTPWMSEVQPLSASAPRSSQPLTPLTIDEYAFRQGDKHRSDNLFIKAEEQPERKQEKKQQQQQQAQQKKQQQQQQNKQQQQKSQDKKQQQQQQKKQQQPQQQSQQDNQQQQGQQDKQQQQPRQEAPSEPAATPEPAAATSEPTAATSGSANATVPDGSSSGTVTESPASASPQPEAATPAKKPQRRTTARRTSKKATEAPVAAENTEQPAVEQTEAPAAPAKKPQRRTAVRKTTKKTTETAPADASADAPKATKAPKTRTTATRTKTKSATTEKKKTVRKTLAEKK
ncbi:MAG: hypothetical protein IKN75_00360 [Prevotella sp.]|nr:hypothetical protein [Prevotella sp.]